MGKDEGAFLDIMSARGALSNNTPTIITPASKTPQQCFPFTAAYLPHGIIPIKPLFNACRLGPYHHRRCRRRLRYAAIGED